MKAAVIGASGGIGRALVEQLLSRGDVETVHATHHSEAAEYNDRRVSQVKVDVTDESSIRRWSESVDELDLLINAVGVLHTPQQQPEKSLRQVDADFFLHNLQINALSTLLLAAVIQDRFRHGRQSVFAAISARVGSIADNRLGGWYSYRASKAALNMIIKTLSVEWKRTLPNVAVVALHPGTTDTMLSRPFQRNVPPGKLFSTQQTARYLLQVTGNLSPSDTGSFLAYDGSSIPW